MGKKLLVNGKKGNLYSGTFGNRSFVRFSLLINRLKFCSLMPGKITIITAAVFLSACSYFQKPEIQVSLNPWTGKTIYFVDLDDKYKQTASFNRVWSKLYKKKFRPYHKFQNKPYTILGTYETWKNDFLIIKDEKNRRYKMLFNFDDDEIPEFPSYILFNDALVEAKAKIGKTIWLNNTLDFKGFYSFADYDFKRFESVTVLDVHPFQNRDFGYPVWLKIIAKNGLDGFVRYNGEEGRVGVQDHYYTSDPLPREWGKEMIDKVLNKGIEIGMTERQVRISIGNPDELNHTSSRHGIAEQWVYGVELGKKVYYQFENGKLTFINK